MLTDTGLRSSINIDINKFNFSKTKNVLNRPTGRFFYDPWEILDEYKNTDIERLLNSFPDDIGEARIIILKPGECYLSHCDIDNRYHFNIQAEQSFLIDLENVIMHPILTDEKIWEMDAGRLHTAANYGSYERAQLVVRKLLKENKIDNAINIILEIDNTAHDWRYRFDEYISGYLNRAVIYNKINNFKILSEKQISFDLNRDYIDELKHEIERSKVSINLSMREINESF
jgi:hypothetical protein